MWCLVWSLDVVFFAFIYLFIYLGVVAVQFLGKEHVKFIVGACLCSEHQCQCCNARDIALIENNSYYRMGLQHLGVTPILFHQC